MTEIENMIPWERDIYVDMLITWIKEQNEKDLKEVKQANKSTNEIKTKKADISKKSPQEKKKTAKKVSKK